MAGVQGIRVVGTGIAKLAHHQANEELSERLGLSTSEIESITGVRRRYVGDPDMTLPSLHALACRAALEGVGPPDLILNASVGFHQLIPDTSIFIQRALGLEGIAGFSMHATCISFLYALQTADALLRAGAYERVLITSAEFNTRVRNFAEPESAALLGDAAAAVVLERAPRGGLRHASIRAYPDGAELTQVTGFGLGRHPLGERTRPEDYLFTMDGAGVLRAGARRFLRHMDHFWKSSGVKREEVSLIVPHQPSRRGLLLLEHYGFPPEKTVNILADYGNCAAVSLPLALAIAAREKRMGDGDLLLLLGMGAGLSVGAMLWEWCA